MSIDTEFQANVSRFDEQSVEIVSFLVPSSRALDRKLRHRGYVLDTLAPEVELPSSAQNESRVRIDHPIVVPRAPQKRRTFLPTGRWEGVVLERYDSYFDAEVIDLDNGETAIAQFDMDDVTPSDLSLCEPGHLFYWTIGYETKDSGQRSRVSVISFRRTGVKSAL